MVPSIGPIDYTKQALCPSCWGTKNPAIFPLEKCDHFPNGRLKCPGCGRPLRTRPRYNRHKTDGLWRL